MDEYELEVYKGIKDFLPGMSREHILEEWSDFSEEGYFANFLMWSEGYYKDAFIEFITKRKARYE